MSRAVARDHSPTSIEHVVGCLDGGTSCHSRCPHNSCASISQLFLTSGSGWSPGCDERTARSLRNSFRKADQELDAEHAGVRNCAPRHGVRSNVRCARPAVIPVHSPGPDLVNAIAPAVANAESRLRKQDRSTVMRGPDMRVGRTSMPFRRPPKGCSAHSVKENERTDVRRLR